MCKSDNVFTIKMLINLFKHKRLKDGRCTDKNIGASHLKIQQLLIDCDTQHRLISVQDGFKSVQRAYTCIALISAVRVEGLGQVQTIETCQGQSLVLDCKDGKRALVIFKAVYSNFDSNACPRNKSRQNLPYNVTQPQCAGDVTSMIKNLCGWRRRCDIVVSSTTIGELCTDSYKLTVLYSCGKVTYTVSLRKKVDVASGKV